MAYLAVSGPAPALAGVRRSLQSRLPDYMLPAALVILDSLPRTPNGKIDRRRLPRPQSPRPDLEPGYVTPASDTERSIARVWSEVLGLSGVGAEDNFFELGGTSLAFAEVHAGLRRELGAELSVVALFRYPDIRSLGGHLARRGAAAGLGDPAQARISARRAAIARRSRLPRSAAQGGRSA